MKCLNESSLAAVFGIGWRHATLSSQLLQLLQVQLVVVQHHLRSSMHFKPADELGFTVLGVPVYAVSVTDPL